MARAKTLRIASAVVGVVGVIVAAIYLPRHAVAVMFVMQLNLFTMVVVATRPIS